MPASATLPELHHLLQVAVGWTDSHLHQFVAGTQSFGVPDEDEMLDQIDETDVRLRDLPTAFSYLYDFGDGWEHEIEILGPGGDQPGCISGEGTCPPEDCGGPGGFAALLAALADPADPEHEQMKHFGAQLVEFDLEATDQVIREVVGAVPESVRLVLDLVAGGAKLTPGGRLPRVLVRRVQELRPTWSLQDRPASVEDDLQPLAVVHDVLRDVGLLRLSKGVLTPTRAATDDLQVVRRLRNWYRPDSFDGLLVEFTVAVLLNGGPMPTEELATIVLPYLGEGWVRDGHPMTVEDVERSLRYLSAEMRGLDLVLLEGDLLSRTWQPGASARSLLPRVPAIARWMANQ